MFDPKKLPSPKKLQRMIKNFTPEQVKYIEAKMHEIRAEDRRSQFKLVRGGRRPIK